MSLFEYMSDIVRQQNSVATAAFNIGKLKAKNDRMIDDIERLMILIEGGKNDPDFIMGYLKGIIT